MERILPKKARVRASGGLEFSGPFSPSLRYRLDEAARLRLVRLIAMHELGIMESTIDAVLAATRANGAQRVHRIVLRVGALSGVEPAALQFAFEVVSHGTPAAGAVLDIRAVPARAFCGDCAVEFEAGAGFVAECPKCGRLCGEIRQGRELELARVEMS